MSTSAAWGVLATNSDAPEEATQRPPFLALRGPSHSHPAALLHRRRRITPWQASSPASSVPFPLAPGGLVAPPPPHHALASVFARFVRPLPLGEGGDRTRAPRVDRDDRLLRQRLLRREVLRREVLRREVGGGLERPPGGLERPP